MLQGMQGNALLSKLIWQGVERTTFRCHFVRRQATAPTPARPQGRENALEKVAMRPQG
jgi:hypothetical protein